MFTDEDAYADRRQREFERKLADKVARETREQEERERRERTPVPVREWQGLPAMLIQQWDAAEAAKRWPHFSVAEMACKCGCGALPDPDFMAWLEFVRGSYGKPMTITSGARCLDHNAKVGGAMESMHLKGMAADVAVDGPGALALIGAAYLWGAKGIGVKQHGGMHMVHLDIGPRETRTLWTYA